MGIPVCFFCQGVYYIFTDDKRILSKSVFICPNYNLKLSFGICSYLSACHIKPGFYLHPFSLHSPNTLRTFVSNLLSHSVDSVSAQPFPFHLHSSGGVCTVLILHTVFWVCFNLVVINGDLYCSYPSWM